MTDVPSLHPFLTDKQFQRGGSLHMLVSKQVKSPIPIMVEHAKAGYLVVSFEAKEKERLQLLGTHVRVRWETQASVQTVDFEVVQEQLIWPIQLLGMIPLAVSVEVKSKTKEELIAPDYIIQVPYKVMGARPSEEKGEGVLLKLSPTRMTMGTDGYVAKGDFINLSFTVPHTKQEVVGMAKVVEKSFLDSQTVLEMIFTDISENSHSLIKTYYKKLSETASS